MIWNGHQTLLFLLLHCAHHTERQWTRDLPHSILLEQVGQAVVLSHAPKGHPDPLASPPPVGRGVLEAADRGAGTVQPQAGESIALVWRPVFFVTGLHTGMTLKANYTPCPEPPTTFLAAAKFWVLLLTMVPPRLAQIETAWLCQC